VVRRFEGNHIAAFVCLLGRDRDTMILRPILHIPDSGTPDDITPPVCLSIAQRAQAVCIPTLHSEHAPSYS